MSSDSMNKIYSHVENYLQNRFPVTAPNAKAKDKKLFKAFKANRSGTPKYKKGEQTFNKKPLRGNLALITALNKNYKAPNKRYTPKYSVGKNKLSSKFSSIKSGKGVYSGSKSTKHSSSKVIDLKFQKKKQRSGNYHEAPQGENVANYLKNNFFLKNNYRKLMKNAPRNRSSSRAKIRGNYTAQPGNKDKTTKEKLVADSYSRVKQQKKKKINYVSEKKLKKLDFKNLLKVESILNKISTIVKSDFEIYDHVKTYVDVVQEEEFSDFYTSIKQIKVKQIMKNCLILERWAMFFIFFFYFNEDVLKKNAKLIRNLTSILHQNVLMCFEFWKEMASRYTSCKKIYTMLDNVILKRSALEKTDYLGYDDFYPIVKNNKTVLNIFVKCSDYLSPEINEGIVSLQKGIKGYSLREGLELCLDSFCKFLIEKGVVSVEYSNENEDGKAKEGKKGEKEETQSTETTKNTNVSSTRQKLKQPPSPYLPKSTMKFTLVLDLDETLVHYEDNGVTGQFYLRPFAQEFLEEMSKYYELVIFTAALQDYADWILNRLDVNKCITHRLYRQHTTSEVNYNVKDLSNLGRDLSTTIIVDNIPENFQLQPENGIYIKSWFKDPDDCALMELMPLLKEIVLRNYSDVRTALQKFRDKMIENIKRGCLQPHLNLNLE